jgi:hypothetical protein
MNFNRKVVSIVAAITVASALSIPAASSSSAADCRYDKWGSNSWSGQKYNCNDGTTMTIKPQWGNSDRAPKNSWERWNGKDSRGNTYGCTYSRWSGWDCR